jgi:cation diffusion facilitator CzcD-associated flavoprotein CzcO
VTRRTRPTHSPQDSGFRSASELPAEVDVLVVGAGISGIGAGWHLKDRCPDRSFAIVDARESIGGTWDLFRYPGVRSDSDMYTLGYRFKPWTNPKSIADGPSILGYLRETVHEHGLANRIHLGVRVVSAGWSSASARWTVVVEAAGVRRSVSCGYLFVCAGYYRYSAGYEADLPGLGDFRGTVVHPQHWPEDLDYAGKRVLVVGSGATAMTIVPAMAATAARVTMLQRSPTYVVARPDVDRIALLLRRVLPERLAYRIIRRKNTAFQQLFFRRMREYPQQARERLVGMVAERLGPEFDVGRHFTPSYYPWDQRLCLLPNGDLLDAIASGRAEVVTDRIERFTADGVRLASGGEIAADIVVTATGLQLAALGEMTLEVDGTPVDVGSTYTYKGLAFSGVPNLATSFGYVNASWTLRSDLTCEYVCRLLNHMDSTGTTTCTPTLRPGEEHMATRPWIDGFTPGYMLRDIHRFPRQGDRAPWLNPQDYRRDVEMLRNDPVDDGVMRFTRPR